MLQLSVTIHLQDLHHHFFIVGDIDGLEHLAVLPPAQLPHQLIVLLITVSERIDMVTQETQKKQPDFTHISTHGACRIRPYRKLPRNGHVSWLRQSSQWKSMGVCWFLSVKGLKYAPIQHALHFWRKVMTEMTPRHHGCSCSILSNFPILKRDNKSSYLSFLQSCSPCKVMYDACTVICTTRTSTLRTHNGKWSSVHVSQNKPLINEKIQPEGLAY